jgi:poly(3-hydroxybutyrate) depolymerase
MGAPIAPSMPTALVRLHGGNLDGYGFPNRSGWRFSA